MKNGALFLCLGCAIALFALACGEDKPVTPPATPPLKYQIEAEQIAVYSAGTLRPSDWLTRQIDHELDLIRSTWGDSLPDVKMNFTPPWTFSSVSIRADQSLYDEIQSGSNAEWNRLISDLDLQVELYNFDWYPRYLSVTPKSNLHPIRIAEYFVGFPGVEYVETGNNLQTWDDYFARTAIQGGARYYFKHNTCPDIYDAFTYIEVKDDSATLLGVHYECFEYMAMGPTIVDLRTFERIVDSLEVNRAAWVDSARSELSRFAHYVGFPWYRGQ